MKISIKKFVFGTVATVAALTLVATSVLASEETTTEENTQVKPGVHQKHKRGNKGFHKGGRKGFSMEELTEEQKAELKEEFGERKELTEEEKAELKEKMEERKAEMEAKMAEKESERLARLKEKLDSGEFTQEQYDKMIEMKPGHRGGKGGPGRKGFGRGYERHPKMETTETEGIE